MKLTDRLFSSFLATAQAMPLKNDGTIYYVDPTGSLLRLAP